VSLILGTASKTNATFFPINETHDVKTNVKSKNIVITENENCLDIMCYLELSEKLHCYHKWRR
jgi:hypothetical protein